MSPVRKPDIDRPESQGRAGRGLGRRLAHALRQIGASRLIASGFFIVLALFFARYGWSVPLADGAERALYDVRTIATAPTVDQDPRVLIVVYNEDTLINTGKRSPLDRGLLARALKRIDAMGPKAVGVDILIDQQQPEDAELTAALKSLRHPTFLAFATNKTSPSFIQPEQETFLRAFLAPFARGPVRPASADIETDPRDGAARHWPRQPPGLPPPLALSLGPARPEFRDYTGGIVFRQPRLANTPVFSTLPIDFLILAPDSVLRTAIAGKYVLIGADLVDVDRFPVPTTTLNGEKAAGVEVHADMLAQALDGRRLAAIPRWTLWAAAVLVVLAGAVTGGADTRRWWLWPSLIVELALLLAAPFCLQARGVDTRSLPMFGWAIGWTMACAAVAAAARSVGAQQRQFAHSALGRYLPRDVANEILRDPERLTLRGEKREIHALFTDLEGFTELTHKIEPEMVALLINRYLEALSEVVLEYGGTLDKFVGDSVVAFWGAPIARPDDADRAARAALAMHGAGEAFRQSAPEGVPALGRTRIGLHRGSAIVGNFGGEGRIQYTAFGDSMNTASRLEAANKQLSSTILVSAQAAAGARIAGFRAMGRIVLRGRATPIDVLELKSDFPEAARDRLNASYARFDAGDTAALEEIAALAAEFPRDAALQDLVMRLKTAGPGGAFALT